LSFSKLFEIDNHLQTVFKPRQEIGQGLEYALAGGGGGKRKEEKAVREIAKQGCGSLSKHWLGAWY
jgi:hypothetical protein